MGYAVYEDRDARNQGVERWAGYGVPAVCDVADCTTEIDRGLAYKCEDYTRYDIDAETEEEIESEAEGCGLYFCGHHGDHEAHAGATPKPDTAEWNAHVLTDESWQHWRDENPAKVAQMSL